MDKLKAFYENNKKTIIYPTLVMLIISVVITLALSVTNSVTAPTIEENARIEAKKAMTSLIKADKYTEGTVELEGEEITYHTALKDKKVKGYIFTLYEDGYGGDVGVMVAVNTDCTVKTIKILDASSETPGLGQNITNEEFYKQFEGKSFGLSTVKNGSAKAENEIDAVTSATFSSEAVTNAVNKALECAEIITKGGAEK